MLLEWSWLSFSIGAVSGIAVTLVASFSIRSNSVSQTDIRTKGDISGGDMTKNGK